MALFESTNEGLGLDIGTSDIKAVWLKKSKGLIRLMAYNTLAIPSDIFSKNSIAKKDNLALSIRKLLAKSKLQPITIEKVNCALPEIMSFIKTIKLPKMPDEELENALRWETKQFVPLPIDKVYWDWQIINRVRNKQEIFLAVAPQQIVNDFYEVIAKAGLIMDSLEVEPLAIIRALIGKQIAKKCILIADIGSQTSNFSIFENGSIRFTHNTLIGGRAQTEILAKYFNIDFAKAEELKVNLPRNSQSQNQIKKVLAPLLNNIADEIKRSIGFYEEQFRKKIDLILLCGGGANLLDIEKYLSRALNMKVEIGNPWTNVTIYPLKIVPRDEIPIYTEAIGLALRNIRDF
jgi:type IV pilus assembly protein PilM